MALYVGDNEISQKILLKGNVGVQLPTMSSDTEGKYLSNDGIQPVWKDEQVGYKQITNCITEIPQDIKLELNDGTLTLKAGSKLYVPDGFEDDGVTPKFNIRILTEDMVRTKADSLYTVPNAMLIICGETDFIDFFPNTLYYSGQTAPSTGTIWYDTTNNLIKINIDGIWTPRQYSLPIGVGNVSNTDGFTSIDQVFNGFGYIGSTKFILPMKGVGTVGKNTDGTYHTVAWEINQVYTETSSSDINGTYWQGFDLFSDGSMAYFGPYVNRNIISPTKPTDTNINWTNPINGYTYYIDNNGVVGTIPYIPIRFALQSLSSGSVTSWSVINNTFTALNYWDKPTISG